jgi:hypothetical protein
MAGECRRGLLRRCIVLLLAFPVAACFVPTRWEIAPRPEPVDAALLLAEDPVDLVADLRPEEISQLPLRRRLRTCCLFGSELRAKLLGLPIPFYRIPNVLDPDALGPHSYDAGAVRVGFADQHPIAVDSERNGLVYTCRGGFIDVAHVRDNVDWALFLAAQFGRNLGEPFEIDLGNEAGRRRVEVKPLAKEVIDRVGRRRISVWLAEWLAFQLSVWHELATWYGFESVSGFPERDSAFSPEDLYSNALGGRLLAGIVHRRQADTASLYEKAVNAWLLQVLAHLKPVPKDVAKQAVAALDGHWWDSRMRLPSPALVLRRNFAVASPLVPWRVPEDVAPPALAALCAGETAQPLWVHGERLRVPLARYVTLRIELDAERAANEHLLEYGGVVTQEDFPALAESVRQQALREFGPRADRPD